ncbi:hypothetical protein BD626DRAFT_504612 [Schizophyllum amplum]|uniref:Uncharacterized protein n=1 Tax=Schizophyllum amplum TaxID=97359 RepID=A0A550C731_9AGAR|nr:hypothetical protein BD626DRAFT_504612 [Auriculariopsis ampla]
MTLTGQLSPGVRITMTMDSTSSGARRMGAKAPAWLRESSVLTVQLHWLAAPAVHCRHRGRSC